MRPGWVIALFSVIAVVCGVIIGVAQAVAELRAFRDFDSAGMWWTTLPTLVCALIATDLTWRVTKEPTGLRDARAAKRLLPGAMFGALCVGVAVLPLLLRGSSFSVTVAQLVSGAGQLLALAPAGVGEELLMRGLAFNALRRAVGDVAAVVSSSLIFGAMHAFNPHASLMAVVIIALTGLWFGALTVRSGSVWLAVGAHVSWNFFEGFVFGQPVSGWPPGTSLFVTPYAEPGFFSGGDFGPEAAPWTAVVLTVAVLLSCLDLRSFTAKRPPHDSR